MLRDLFCLFSAKISLQHRKTAPPPPKELEPECKGCQCLIQVTGPDYGTFLRSPVIVTLQNKGPAADINKRSHYSNTDPPLPTTYQQHHNSLNGKDSWTVPFTSLAHAITRETKKAGKKLKMATQTINTVLAAREANLAATAIPDEAEKGGVFEAASVLQQRASEIRGQRVNWQSYLQSQMISDQDHRFISRFDSAPDAKGRDAVISSEAPLQLAETFYTLLNQVSKDTTVQYLLTLLDDVLQEDKTRVEIFKAHSAARKESPWVNLLTLLNRPDGFIMNMTARIIAKIACWSKQPMEGSDLQFYLTWLKDQLKTENESYLPSVARCLQMMLRLDPYRVAFSKIEGIATIVAVLSSKINFQIQYQLSFCLWVLAFNSSIAAKLNKFGIIPILSDILTDAQKEKVSRIILAVFRNLIEKVDDPQVVKENCISMVQCKVLKQLEFLEQRKFDDEDIAADIEFLKEKMEESLQDLSSFDEYVTEVHSGRLEWSPVHRSEKFWRENADKMNEKNYELLKMLIHLLETSKDNLVLSVACFDLGEYVRHYGRGKHVLEQLGGKTLVMSLLTHPDPNVRYEALLAVQKLMVHNWEYLGRKLKQETEEQKPQGIMAS